MIKTENIKAGLNEGTPPGQKEKVAQPLNETK